MRRALCVCVFRAEVDPPARVPCHLPRTYRIRNSVWRTAQLRAPSACMHTAPCGFALSQDAARLRRLFSGARARPAERLVHLLALLQSAGAPLWRHRVRRASGPPPIS
eukprot:943447-Pleurochrysis_carterae.AAC.1